MAALPSNLALANIQDGTDIIAADHRNNYSAIQIAVNSLITALSGGTAGQLLQALDSADVGWLALALQKVSWVGMPTMSTSTSSWPTANAAILVPFTLQQAQTIDRVHFRTGATQSGNFDVGVLDSTGTRKVSKGSTAQSTLTASAVNEVTFASTPLTPGQYYLALACDNTTGNFRFSSESPDISAKYQLQVATSFPLPASLTPGSTHPTLALPMSAPVT